MRRCVGSRERSHAVVSCGNANFDWPRTAAIAAAGLSVREAIRSKQPEYMALGLNDPVLSDDALLDAMLANPILIERPLVASPLGVRMCRPSERVLEILPPG